MTSEHEAQTSVESGSRPMTLAARFTNVFVAPGEVFEAVREGPPSMGSWLMPFLLACVVAVTHVLVLFSQETTLHQVREMQERALDRKLAKIPAEQADQVRQKVEQFSRPEILKITGSVGAVVGQSSSFFLVALFFWLVGTRFLGGRFGYGAALEVCGLANLIGVVGAVMGTMLMAGFGNILASPGPILLVREMDPANGWHLVLASISIMTLWQLGVVAVGLARLSGTTFRRTVWWVVVPWVFYRGAAALAGWAGSRL